MTTTIEWIKRGCIEIAELPDGRTAMIRDAQDDTSVPIDLSYYYPDGNVHVDCYQTTAEAKAAVDNKYITKPIDSGPDWSFWVSQDKTRSAHVSGRGATWWVDRNVEPLRRFHTRAAAESAAAKYVRGEG